MRFIILFIAGLVFIQCQSISLVGPEVNKVPEFDSYWGQGKAEITSYELHQARYGEMREGEAILIFVTEEFSKEKQVKLDNASIPYDQKIPVLKMNFLKKFNTGIYPYSMMLSSFVAAGGVIPWQAIKISASVQEWCGHVYSQLNQRPDHYLFLEHSYFESEADQEKKIDRYMTEDALWNLIRINPDALIQSDSIMIIPSLLFSRLTHHELKPYRAVTKKLDLDNGNKVFQIVYPELERTLFIEYESTFPYAIVKWSEEYKDGYGPNAKILTTTGIRKKQVMLDYWNKHAVADDSLRMLLKWERPGIDPVLSVTPL